MSEAPDQDYRRAAAFDNRILHGLVGSTVHGLELIGHDDRDEMGVFIEPPESAVGLRPFEHWVERTQPEGVRSGPGELDLTLYSLRKFVRLALAGNPSILLLLFVPDDQLQLVTPAGRALRELAPAFISVRVRDAYSGTWRLRRSASSASAAACPSSGPSWFRPTATTRNMRCTRSGSASRASSCSRRAG